MGTRVISFLNIKGGVGKTISTTNIGAALDKMGYSVLIIDIDPQSNATKYLSSYKENDLSSYELLKGETGNYIKATKYNALQIVPGNIKLIMAENEIMLDTRKARETRLKKWIDSLDHEFDFILIDCPPSLNILTTNALVASTEVLVPIKIDKFALDGFEYLMSAIEETREEFNPHLNLLGAFITMDKSTTINRDIKAELDQILGDKFLKQTIRENVAVTKSTFHETPVIYHDPKSNSAKDYIKLTEEIVNVLTRVIWKS